MNDFIKIGMVDDHKLVREAIARFINTFPGCKVTLEADSGKEMIANLNPSNLPDIILLDINMPDLNGYGSAEWLRNKYPQIRILILSMHDAELAMFRLLQFGVRGFLNKGIDPPELERAIRTTMTTGFYYGPNTGKLLELLKTGQTSTILADNLALSDSEIRFLELAASEMTYKEIARKMKVSPRTVDNYRDSLFQKLDVRTRTGLVLIAIRCAFVHQNSIDLNK